MEMSVKIDYKILTTPSGKGTVIYYRTTGVLNSSLELDHELACSYGGGIIESFIRLHVKPSDVITPGTTDCFYVDCFGAAGMQFELTDRFVEIDGLSYQLIDRG